MTAIIDYGVGNLFSLLSSFKKIGEQAIITSNAADLQTADRIVLPGVGAFYDAAQKLQNSGLTQPLLNEIKKGKPVLGICLGMQLLFDQSLEYGQHKGLGLIGGSAVPISDYVKDLKIPHMGWNALHFQGGKHRLFKYINEGDFVYFVHSYFVKDCEKNLIAYCDYGIKITAAAAENNLMGCQFHPEKSGETGLKILKSFCEMKEGAL